MKHYTYKERYERIRKALGAYMKGNDGYIKSGRGMPYLKYSVELAKDSGRRKLYLDVSAKAAPVGYGVDSIAKMVYFNTMPWPMHLAIGNVESVVNHPLRDQGPSVKIDRGKKVVHFRYTINPRKGL